MVNGDKPSWQVIIVFAASSDWREAAEFVTMGSNKANSASVPSPAEALICRKSRPVAQGESK
jgi:hypothetical protein